jgi:uncharacterized protein (TIGR03083 family)
MGADVGRFTGDVLATEYRAARERMQAIASTLDDDLPATPVPACPAWTVKDLFAHVTGIAADLGAGNRPDGDTQAWVDRQIDDRRARPLAEIVDEWAQVAPRFEQMIEERPSRLWGLTYDTVVHEHDLRNAVRRPGARDSVGVRVATELGLALVDADLRRLGLPAFRARFDDRDFVVGEGAVELELATEAFECLRLLGSRRTVDDLRAAPFVGDLDRYLPGIVHMDVPAVSLGE